MKIVGKFEHLADPPNVNPLPDVAETDLNFGRTPIIRPNPASPTPHSSPPPQVHSDPSNSLSSESDGRTLSSLDTAASSVETGVVKPSTPICIPDHTMLRRIFTDAFLGLVGQKPRTVQDREFRELEFKRHLQTFIPRSQHYIVDDVYCFFLGFIPDVPEQMNHDALDRLVPHPHAPRLCSSNNSSHYSSHHLLEMSTTKFPPSTWYPRLSTTSLPM